MLRFSPLARGDFGLKVVEDPITADFYQHTGRNTAEWGDRAPAGSSPPASA